MITEEGRGVVCYHGPAPLWHMYLQFAGSCSISSASKSPATYHDALTCQHSTNLEMNLVEWRVECGRC